MAITVLSSAQRSVDVDSSDLFVKARGGAAILDISSTSGLLPTLDVKFQRKDTVSSDYVDIPGAAFPQQTATGTTMLTIYPGIGETANESVSDSLNGTIRASTSISNTFTYSLSLEEIP